jgi:membrane protein DedA with SNARE-associated domain
VLAGGSGMPWRTFVFYNATGAVTWCTVIGFAGYLLGRSWDVLDRWVGRIGIAGAVAVVVLIVLWHLRTRGQATS